MTKRMLIDATHAEETRVVVLDGNRLEDFDVETSTKRQLKGNIYLAKVVRVEPSLQAAFVEYGGNRHGFLAFSEIHPDYYQIPVADRQRLIEMQAEEARREEEEADLELALSHGTDQPGQYDPSPDAASADQPNGSASSGASAADALAAEDAEVEDWARPSLPLLIAPPLRLVAPAAPVASVEAVAPGEPALNPEPWATPELPPLLDQESAPEPIAEVEDPEEDEETDPFSSNVDHIGELPPPETMGGDQDSGDDQRERRLTSRFMRNYKIQEVIRRRQILLIQVVKEERGTKGAALTTYLSLAGRFGVLMPNSPRGGGISRKITSAADRRRLKEVMAELDIPRGMGMIVRTAGANRPKPEIKRDCEYLLRLWDDIRDHTMKSVAPALIYEEASLIKRAIRDVYSRDIDEILVDGEAGWRAAHDFMRMLMPSHAKKVQLWRDGGQPLFARQQVESQLDGMLIPTVQLRSGGYLVINQAEALVAIDVNSGRSTRERNIEETALRTNLEAADEVARQLRLRDLAGLIVIDFIDMESKRHNAMVERRMKEALKNDRARIQVGHISHFGLLEMSRQRLRPSLAETSFMPCPHCGGTGHVRSTENAAIHVLRGIEDEGSRLRAAEVVVHVSTPVALYLLNHKRERLQEIELRYAMRIIIAADDAQIAPQFRVERVRLRSADEIPAAIAPDRVSVATPVQEAEPEEEDAAAALDEDEETEEDGEQPLAAATGEADGETSAEEAERRRRKRRRRRRGGRKDEAGTAAEEAEQPLATLTEAVSVDEVAVLAVEVSNPEPVATEASGGPDAAEGGEVTPGSDEDLRNRRRGRRGGRRRRRDEGDTSPFAVPGAEQPDLPPTYAGPTPADPFGGRAFDIFDVMDQAERQAEATPPVRAASAAEIVNASGPEPEDAMVDGPSNEPPPAPVPTQEAAPPIAPELTRPATEILNTTAPEPARVEMKAPAEAKHPAEPENLAEPGWMADSEKAADPEGSTGMEKSVGTERLADPESPAKSNGLAGPERPAEGVSGASEPAVSAHSVPTPANDVQADVASPEPPPAEPAIKPILVGASGEPPVERKRGWWRR